MGVFEGEGVGVGEVGGEVEEELGGEVQEGGGGGLWAGLGRLVLGVGWTLGGGYVEYAFRSEKGKCRGV